MQDLQPTHLFSSVTIALVPGARFRAPVGQISIQGGFSQCWQTVGMKTEISSHFFARIREREEPQEPSWERLQAISQDWHPVHRSGIIEMALILTSSVKFFMVNDLLTNILTIFSYLSRIFLLSQQKFVLYV